MGKTDVVVRTAADLEKKYNFASLLGLKKNVEITAQGIQKIENELNSMLNALVINLKDVLDSQSEISLWFYSGKPTTSNVPYTLWDNPNDHIGDIYYDQKTGAVYQWNGVWEVNTHPDLVEAMAITNAEIDTSEDHERKVFFNTPTIPYSNGDWWVKEDGSLFICQISKASGEYETADFINSNDYVESFAEKIGEELKVLKGTVTIISENYAKFTDLATGGSTVISGDNIVTGNIKSQNYIENTSGTKINLNDGTIDTKNFKTDEEGHITCNDIDIKGGKIELYQLSENDDPALRIERYGRDDAITSVNDGGFFCTVGNAFATVQPGAIQIIDWGTDESTEIYSFGIFTPTLTQTSKVERKKNFELLENGLDIIKNTDIYKFHLKNQNDNEKKHIGFVIGDNYNYRKEITSTNNDGVDLYSMVAVAYKAIQEQQQEIESLKKEISKLKEG